MAVTDARWFRVGTMIGSAILAVAVVALAVVGVVSLVSGENSGTQEPAMPAATNTQPAPTEPAPIDEQPGETAEPYSGPQRTCLDGTQVPSGDQCDLLSNDVVFAVAGVSSDECTQIADPPGNAPGQSFTCTIETGEMQVGRFLNASTKNQRIAKYRKYNYCAPYENMWQVCGGGGPGEGWLRVYLDDDLLMYMASKDKGVLLSLDGVSDDTVRHGE